eukprot:752073-Hanusia_phi.AAC.5
MLVFGRAYFDVQLFDDGGTAWGGSDRSQIKRFYLLWGNANTLPSMQETDVVEVDENDMVGESQNFLYFADPQASPSLPPNSPAVYGDQRIITDGSFEVMTTSEKGRLCFREQPAIDRAGSLSFVLLEGMYGRVSMKFRLVTSSFQTPWSYFDILINPVNQPPSFSLAQGSVQLLEDTPRHRIYQFARNIKTGRYSDSMLLNLSNYNNMSCTSSEDSQTVSFHVTLLSGNLNLLSAWYILADGTLDLLLAPHENGNVSLMTSLQDSGGVVKPGDQDTSAPQIWHLHVVSVNDPPSFDFTLQPLVIVEEKFFNRRREVSFFKNLRWTQFGGSFVGPPDEANQSLTFHFHIRPENSTLFKDIQGFANGTFYYEIRPYAYGDCVIEISGCDNGDRDATCYTVGHNLSVVVIPVNSAPTIGLPRDLWLWINPYDTIESAMMVQEWCCSPCPSLDLSCNFLSDCCSPWNSCGDFRVLPSKANYSAGPYESSQLVSFMVRAAGGDNINLLIGDSGNMTLSVVPMFSGNASFVITTTDDGGGGVVEEHWRAENTSTHLLTVNVMEGFLRVALRFDLRNHSQSMTSADEVVSTVESMVANRTQSGSLPIVLLSCSASDGEMATVEFAILSYHMSKLIDMNQRVKSLITSNFTSEASMFDQAMDTWPDHLEADPKNCTCSESLKYIDLESISLLYSLMELRSLTQTTPEYPDFDIAEIILVNESSRVSIPIISNIRVDSGLLMEDGAQHVKFVVSPSRYRSPASGFFWSAFNGSFGAFFEDPPTINAICSPYCHSAEIELHTSYIHGVTELIVTLFSRRTQLNKTKTILVAVQPVPHQPIVRPRYANNLTILEDNGTCYVDSCTLHTWRFKLFEIYEDKDEWFRGGDMLRVVSSDASQVEVRTVYSDFVYLEIQPGLHVHGVFNLTATDSTGLSTQPPLRLIVQHVNHPPFVRNNSIINFTHYEDIQPPALNLSDIFYDVDMEDHHDPYAPPDTLTYYAVSSRADLMQVQVDGEFLLQLLLPNQHGLIEVEVTAVDSMNVSVTATLTFTVVSIPDAPFVLNLPPFAAGLTIYEQPATSEVLRFNLSYMFADFDDCRTMAVKRKCYRSEYRVDALTITVETAWATRLKVWIVDDELFVEPLPYMHSFSITEIHFNIIVHDWYNLSSQVLVPIWIVPVNNIPIPLITPLTFLEGQLAVQYVIGTLNDFPSTNFNMSTDEASLGVLAFVDFDAITNLYSDSLQFSMFTDQPDMLNVTLLAYVNGTDNLCAFPFEHNGQIYDNCTNIETIYEGHASVCKDKQGNWGTCQHILSIDFVPGQFGQGKIYITASDSYGGTVDTFIPVNVSMINTPVNFSVPSELNVITITASDLVQLTTKLSFVHIYSMGSRSPLPRSEDQCFRPPVLPTDCHSNSSVGQTYTFHVAVGDRSLFDILPTVNIQGDLIFKLKIGVQGSTLLQLTVEDDGGYAHGGVNTSTKELNLIVSEVNQPPFFKISPSLQALERISVGDTYQYEGFAYDIDPGAGLIEAWQKLTFHVELQIDVSEIFQSPPAISSNGTLSFLPKLFRHGTFQCVVYLEDDAGGQNRSIVREFTLDILQVNNPPTFCIPDTLVLVAEEEFTSANFVTSISTGGLDDCVNSCNCSSGPFGQERTQNLSFIISYSANQQEPCAQFEASNDMSLFKVFTNGTVDIRAINWGRVNVSITLVDDGGVAHGGVNYTTRNIQVDVRNKNKHPSFTLSSDSRIIVNAGSAGVIHFADNISWGHCEEFEQPLSFALEVVDFCIPAIFSSNSTVLDFDAAVTQCSQSHNSTRGVEIFRCPPDNSSAPNSTLESIFTGSSWPTLYSNGTMQVDLQPGKYGIYVFLVTLSDGELCYQRQMEFVVQPVNTAPSADLPPMFNTTEHPSMGTTVDEPWKEVVRNVRAGVWEDYQRIRFTIRGMGPEPLVQCAKVLACLRIDSVMTRLQMFCNDTQGRSNEPACLYPQDGSSLFVWSGNFELCASHVAELWIWPYPFYYGVQTLEITIQDDGPLDTMRTSFLGNLDEISPVNVFQQNVTVTSRLLQSFYRKQLGRLRSEQSIKPRSSTCRLRMCLRCKTRPASASLRSRVIWRRRNAGVNISKGDPVENPLQSVTFFVQSIWMSGPILEEGPFMSADGTLSFKLARSQYGAGNFTVFLKDSFNATSQVKVFRITVIDVNDRPFFYMPPVIYALEGAVFNAIVCSNITRDSSGITSKDTEKNQIITFLVQTFNPEFFVVAPAISANGLMTFKPREFAFGSITISVQLKDNGGTANNGKDTSAARNVTLSVLPVNQVSRRYGKRSTVI